MNRIPVLHRTVLRKATVLASCAGQRSGHEFGPILQMLDAQHRCGFWEESSYDLQETNVDPRDIGRGYRDPGEFRRALRQLWGSTDDIEKGFSLVRRMSERCAALESLPSLVEQQNRDLQSLFEKLYQLENVHDINDTLEKIWTVWKNHPDEEVQKDFRKALESLKEMDVSQARKILDKVIALDPNYAEAFNQRAMIYYMGGKHTEAMRDLMAALDLEPRHIVALSGLAKIQRELAQPEEKETLKKILELCPNDSNVRNRMAEL